MKKIYLFLVSIILLIFFIFFSYHYLNSTKQVSNTTSSYQKIKTTQKASTTKSSKSIESSSSSIINSHQNISYSQSLNQKDIESDINNSNNSKYLINNNEVNDLHKSNILYKAKQKVDLKNTKEAADYLRNILGYNDSNIIVGGDDSYNGTDKNGKYYFNLKHKLQGKTGLIGIYKVYTNGNYIQQV